MDIRSAQNLAWENKLAKGFNTTDVPLEFCLLNGEVAEAFDAWRKGGQNAAEELADAAIYLLGLAEMTGTDLQAAVEAKLDKNAARTLPAVAQRCPGEVRHRRYLMSYPSPLRPMPFPSRPPCQAAVDAVGPGHACPLKTCGIQFRRHHARNADQSGGCPSCRYRGSPVFSA
jgi:hypothetical protein